MIRPLFHAAAMLLVVALLAPVVLTETVVTVLTDREDALYAVDATATFRISVTADGAPVTAGEVAYELGNDGWQSFSAGALPLAEAPITISGSLNAPGFLRCTVKYTDAAGNKVEGIAAAGFDPLKIKPSLPVPDDFDAFWAGKKAVLAGIPMNPRLTPVESVVGGVDAFDLQLDCAGGAPVSGYYCIPDGAAERLLPALLYVHGAGVGSSTLHPELAAEGMLVLDINAHGIPNGQSKEFYEELANGRLKNYRLEGREDRETYYFLGMYFRLMRAMDFLTAQPAWDGKTLIVRGSSQGGGQSLVAAGLDSRVTLLCPGVPAMCEHTGAINGWPRLVPRDEAGNPDPKVQEVARYYDAMNFATRTTAEALVSVGFIDNTCRPTTVYAAFNNLRGEKEMFNMPLMGHKNAPGWDGMVLERIKAHIAKSN